MAERQGDYVYSPEATTALRQALSADRFETFRRAAGYDDPFAFELYLYNARIAKAFLFPLHVAEVTTRNAIDAVLVDLFGVDWPVAPNFRRQLADGGVLTLDRALERAGGVRPHGQVVATLTFDFWSNMLRPDYDRMIWQTRLPQVFPHAAAKRRDIQQLVRSVNRFRNRIAHHEPVLGEDTSAINAQILRLIGLRCPVTEDWVRRHSTVASAVRSRPKRIS